MANLQIEPGHLEIIRKILAMFSVESYIFGSRAKGTARQYSDLDIVLKGDVDRETLSKIRDAFEESNLPYKVDVILWNDIDDNFKRHIQFDMVLLK